MGVIPRVIGRRSEGLEWNMGWEGTALRAAWATMKWVETVARNATIPPKLLHNYPFIKDNIKYLAGDVLIWHYQPKIMKSLSTHHRQNLTHFRPLLWYIQPLHFVKSGQAGHAGCCQCPIEGTDAFGFVIAPPAASIRASGFATMVCSRAAARICLRALQKIW